MKRYAAAAAAFVTAFALAGLAGSASAGGGHDKGGNPGDAQQHQQAAPRPQDAKKDDHGPKQDSHGQQQSQSQQPEQSQQQGSGDHKVYICHATGSQSNPYVLIHVDEHALKAHTGHQDGRDIVLGSSPGICPTAAAQSKPEQSKPEESKPAPAPEQAPQKQESEHAKVYICHATGSESNPYVLIHVDEHALKGHEKHHDGRDIVLGSSIGAGCPAASSTPQSSVQTVTFCDMESATTGKLETKAASEVVSHELNGTPEEARDIVPAFTFNGTSYSQLWDANGQALFNAGCNLAPASAPVQSSAAVTQTTTETTTTTVTTTANVAATTTTQQTAGVAGTATTTATPAAAPATAAPQTSGVLGTTATLTVPKSVKHPSSGVLGTLGRIATGTTLPFTGLKLWIVELIALALIGLGVATRLYARGRA